MIHNWETVAHIQRHLKLALGVSLREDDPPIAYAISRALEAVTATARKIAVLFYNTLRHGMSYRDPGADQYEQQYRSRVLANLQRRAKSLGFVLQAVQRQSGCFLGRPRPSLRGKRHEVRLHREAPEYLAGGMAMRCNGRIPVRLPCLAEPIAQRQIPKR